MSDILELLVDLPEVAFEPGETVIAEGEAAEGLFFLTSGSVVISRDGIEVSEATKPGSVVGEMSFILDGPTTATVKAKERCTFKLARQRREFLRQNPEVATHIALILAQRLDSLTRYLVDLKKQFGDRGDHLGMVGEILDSIMNNQPRAVRKSIRECDEVDD